MIEPFLRDDEFLEDVQAARQLPGFHLWWLGQSGFLVQWQNRHLLIDPYLSDSLTRKYATTDKPHVRMTARVIAPDRLNFIDLVTASHGHTDHLDGDTLRPLKAANPTLKIVMPAAIRALALERTGPIDDLPLDAGNQVDQDGFQITALPSAHESVEHNESGQVKCLGYVFRFGEWSIYHSGDTVSYDGLADLLRPHRVDLALLPINGRDSARKVSGNLSGSEAAQLAHDIGARCVVPCHYEMFEFNTASPQEFTHAAQRLNQPYFILRAGERWSSGRL